MRNTIIGAVLGAVVIGLLFWAASSTFHPTPVQRVAQSAAQIGKGFVGAKMVGLWEVACSAQPVFVKVGQTGEKAQQKPPADEGAHDAATAQPGDAGKPSPAERGGAHAKTVSFGRCRTMLEMAQRNRPRRPLLSVVFRLVGEEKSLTALVNFPSIGKRGEAVLLGVKGGTLKLPVTGCSRAACVAMSRLSPQAQSAVLASPAGIVVLPAGPGGRRANLRIPFFGLTEAVSAMRRAEG